MRGELRTDPAGRAAAEPGLCPSQPVRIRTLAAALGGRRAASAKLSVGAPAGSVVNGHVGPHQAPVAQRIEQPVSTRSVGGSSPSGRAYALRRKGFLAPWLARIRV